MHDGWRTDYHTLVEHANLIQKQLEAEEAEGLKARTAVGQAMHVDGNSSQPRDRQRQEKAAPTRCGLSLMARTALPGGLRSGLTGKVLRRAPRALFSPDRRMRRAA